jgi:hypothetical protein
MKTKNDFNSSNIKSISLSNLKGKEKNLSCTIAKSAKMNKTLESLRGLETNIKKGSE